MTTFSRISFCFLFAASLSTHAQTAPPHLAHDEPVSLENIVVTASPLPRTQAELVSATTVLAGRALQLKRQPTLGETLSEEVGMSSTSFGPGASRPIIRGLGGDRIRLLENGVGTLDASVTSPDHAVSVEPFLVKRIEVVRGPASLLYGSSAVGGVVNVITHRIETEMPEETVSGSAEIGYGTAANRRSYGAVTDVAVRRTRNDALVLHVDGFRRVTGDLEIPGYAESDRLRAEEAAEALEHGEVLPDERKGSLPNSRIESDGGAAGLSWVNKDASLGVAYSGFNSLYGVPGHAHAEEGEEAEGPVRIDLRQRRIDVQGELRRELGALTALRFKLGQADYRHRELEGAEIGTVFANRGYELRAEALHAAIAGFEGAFGVQASRSDFAAIGTEAFLPPTLSRTQAVFLAEEAKRGALTWQWGGRYEWQEVEVKDGSARRREGAPSASAGMVWSLAEPYALALSVSHTERAPNAQELYSNGPHVGTNAYEIGDPTLKNEKSLGLEIGLRRTAGFVTGAAAVYANRFDGHIAELATGRMQDGLIVYRYESQDADFWGAELEAIFHLHTGTRHQLDLRVAGDFTRAEDDRGRALPRIPALKGSVGLDWAVGSFAAGASIQQTGRQSRVASNETETEGYTLVGAYVTYRVALGRTTWDWYLRGTNLADEEVRPHTSFLKDLAPLAGRGFTAGVQLGF